MGLKYIKISIFICLLVLFVGATYEEILNDKKRQVEIIEKNIADSRSSLSNYSNEIAGLRKQIDSIESAVNALNDFLKNYKNQTYLTPNQVAKETGTIIALTQEVEKIQESFRQKVLNLYKRGKNYELELLLSAKTPNEYLRRNEYLQRFSQSRKKELRDLKAKKFILEERRKMLTLSTSSQRINVESRRNEKASLESKLKQLTSQKSKLEYYSSMSAEKIIRYETQLNNTKNFINNFEANKDKFNGNKNNRLNYDSFDLAKVKGNLNVPVDVALISNSFGENTNGATFAKSFNNGLDFSVSKGSKVYAVASGVVSLVGELPYYGKVVIIKHENGFRTVYAVLSDVKLAPGDNVKLNQLIGKTAETIDGQSLHFELWQNAAPLNPAEWLRF
jgi:septal ring factor EnvC (AmiA/AmiB activator)